MSEVNLKSSTIEKGLDLAKDFLQTVVKPSLNELGELFADKVKLWRLQNQLKNLDKVKKIIQDNNIETKEINLKVLFPYLEAVSLEDDETLQDMWANLFVNYVDAEKNLTLVVYPEILRQLSTNEVKIIKFMGEGNRHLLRFYKYNEFQVTDEEVSNLVRLGIIEQEIDIEDNEYFVRRISNGGKIEYKFKKTNHYFLTSLGQSFLSACESPNNRN